MPSMTLEQGLNAAMRLQQAGRLEEAERIYRQILEQHADCADALHLLGVLCAQREKYQEGAHLIRKAIALHPNVAGFQINLGNVLLKSSKPEEAVTAFEAAVRLQPTSAEPRNGLAAAIAMVADAHREAGRFDEAIAAFKNSVTLRADVPEVYLNLALAFEGRGRLEEALAANDKAISLRPESAIAWSNRAKTLRKLGQLEQSISSARRAVAISPRLAEGWINLAGALLNSGDVDGALEAAGRAIEINPRSAIAQNLAANVFKEAGEMGKAVAALDLALEVDPDNAMLRSNKIYMMEFDPASDAAGIFAEQRQWNERHAGRFKGAASPHENDRTPERRLRIGYVSPYFREHSQAFFLVPLLENHDREKFEIYCYSDTHHVDGVTQRLRDCTNTWRDTHGLKDKELADQIRRDRVDILVDLVMHMAENRALVFARKPAPMQAAWLAYPGGTGLDAMDYRITDPQLNPPGTDEGLYHEKPIHLPHTFWCYDPLADGPAVSPLPALENGFVTFGCLNNFCKVNEEVLRLWARVLQAVKRSRMIIQCPEGKTRDVVLRLLEVDRDRIEFVARCSRPKYLELYQRIDLGLDTFPYNGHTTSLDSCWMGVPVVTLVGDRVAGRAGLSQLTNLGLIKLIARASGQYVEIASSLAKDLTHLGELRSSLRSRMEGSLLMDARAFARNMEDAFQHMWTQWCKS
jgi:protein O-GlcNAc transferase